MTEDVNKMIRHCFTLSQQQKVTKSKYIKDLGRAKVEHSDADDIINAATTQGIYDLTLGLLDKERRVMVAGKAHEASAITYGEAKEGALEAHNFSSSASITTTHSRNERKRDAASVATEKTLAKSVYSLDTSRVTEEDDMEDKKNESKEESNSDDKSHATKKITIEGMKMLAEQRTRFSEKTLTYGSCKENTETSGSNKSSEEEAEKNREKSDSENSWKEEG